MQSHPIALHPCTELEPRIAPIDIYTNDTTNLPTGVGNGTGPGYIYTGASELHDRPTPPV